MAKLRPFYERYFGPMTGAESLQFRNWLAKIGYWPVIEAIEAGTAAALVAAVLLA